MESLVRLANFEEIYTPLANLKIEAVTSTKVSSIIIYRLDI